MFRCPFVCLCTLWRHTILDVGSNIFRRSKFPNSLKNLCGQKLQGDRNVSGFKFKIATFSGGLNFQEGDILAAVLVTTVAMFIL